MIEKILTEINRLKNELDGYSAKEGLDYIESYINTLSKQQVKEPDKSLEEAARHSEILTYPMPDDGDIEEVMKVQEARIFHEIGFKAGAEWQAKQLLQGSPMPEDTVLFNKGVAEGKKAMREQMLKDAVEGYVSDVIIHADGDELKYSVEYPIGKRPHSSGDKVHLVVLKAEEE